MFFMETCGPSLTRERSRSASRPTQCKECRSTLTSYSGDCGFDSLKRDQTFQRFMCLNWIRAVSSSGLAKHNNLGISFPCCVGSLVRRTDSDIAWFQDYAAMYVRSAIFWDSTQRRMVVCPESSVRNYHSTLRNIPMIADLRQQQHKNPQLSPYVVIIIIIIYLSWSWATCWSVPVSRIQKSLQRSNTIPSASWGVVFHYPG